MPASQLCILWCSLSFFPSVPNSAAPTSLVLRPALRRLSVAKCVVTVSHFLQWVVVRVSPVLSPRLAALTSFSCLSYTSTLMFIGNSRQMLAAPAIDLTFDDESDWRPMDIKSRLSRTASVGNSWGVTSIGGGYSWSANKDAEDVYSDSLKSPQNVDNANEPPISRSSTPGWPETGWSSHRHALTSEPIQCSSPVSRSPPRSSAVSLSTTPESSTLSLNGDAGGSTRPPNSRSPSMPRPRRRSSQQRVSLIAGRLNIVSIDPPEEQTHLTPTLKRFGSQSSFLSSVSSTEATPAVERESFLGEKSISEYVIEGEIGRGAYGLVKRAREMNLDGTMGVSGQPTTVFCAEC